jgi:hypothetical protein
MQQVKINISDKVMQEYIDFRREEKIKRIKKQKLELEEAKIEQAFGPETEPIDSMEAGRKYVSQIVEASQMLGLTKSQGMDWGKIASVVLPMIPVVMEYLNKSAQRQQEQMNQYMTLMMSTMSNNNNQLMEVLKNQNGDNAGLRAVKQYQDMITGIIDLKGTLGDMGKESIADKVFKLLESLAPHVVALLSMPRQQALSDPRMTMAKAYANFSPDIAALRSNPQELTRLVGELDDFYGWEQSDQMLAIMGFTRPDESARLAQKRYPKGDERNNITDGLTAPVQKEEIIQLNSAIRKKKLLNKIGELLNDKVVCHDTTRRKE